MRIDKKSWGKGEWQKEPDELKWVDEETNYHCFIYRDSNTGSLCGYVEIAKQHPFFSLDHLSDTVERSTSCPGIMPLPELFRSYHVAREIPFV